VSEKDAATLLREWAAVLQIPSGSFVNEDLMFAAAEIARLRDDLIDQTERGDKATTDCHRLRAELAEAKNSISVLCGEDIANAERANRAEEEIARLRAELVKVVDQRNGAEKNCDHLRAELAEANSGSELAARQLLRACEKVNDLEAAARRDAEEIARLKKRLEKYEPVEGA